AGGGRLGEVIAGGFRVERLGFPRRGDRLLHDFRDRIDALIFRGDAADEGGQVVDRGEFLRAEGGERLGGGQGPGFGGCVGGLGVSAGARDSAAHARASATDDPTHTAPSRTSASSPRTSSPATEVSTRTPRSMSSSVVNSRSQWETPSTLGTNIITAGTRWFIATESWPAMVSSRR